MITFYIDDSGTVGLNDSSQPILLYSAICLENNKVVKVKQEICTLIESIKKDIEYKFQEICNTPKVFNNEKAKKFQSFLSKKLLQNGFEIHCSEIIRGDDLYLFFDNIEREKYIENAIQILTNHNIKIVTIVFDKEEFNKTYGENKKKFQEIVSERIAEELNNTLINEKKQGIAVFDEGNQIVENELKKKLQNGEITFSDMKLSPMIQLAKSDQEELIQLADVAAYINNTYLVKEKRVKAGENVNSIKAKRADKFFALLEKNNEIKYGIKTLAPV